jgi:hypothetical protein
MMQKMLANLPFFISCMILSTNWIPCRSINLIRFYYINNIIIIISFIRLYNCGYCCLCLWLNIKLSSTLSIHFMSIIV